MTDTSYCGSIGRAHYCYCSSMIKELKISCS